MRLDRRRGPTPSSRPDALLLALLLAPLLVLVSLPRHGGSAAAAEDSCVACHSDPDFMVTNRKLYDYFQRWTLSVHSQEEVTCADCHGGNPEVADKDGAHGAALVASDTASAVNFRNIPDTCGGCHEEIYQGFQESTHFEHVVAKQQEDQGPTCVTCHGSINVSVLNVTTVEDLCSRCHNEESDNHPENAAEARLLLNKFLSIHRYYRYITVRGEPDDTRPFFKQVDAQIHSLSVAWHTFDLDEIRAQTDLVLNTLREKRQEVARLYKERREAR
jgi:nitrate/TMAO reductase-like tetraheme cytochrome c subunit